MAITLQGQTASGILARNLGHSSTRQRLKLFGCMCLASCLSLGFSRIKLCLCLDLDLCRSLDQVLIITQNNLGVSIALQWQRPQCCLLALLVLGVKLDLKLQ